MTIDPLPRVLGEQNLILTLSKILDPRWRSLWPSEFHFCGCDSEPLLSDAVLGAIKFLLQRNRVVEVITNGLLLDKKGIICAHTATSQYQPFGNLLNANSLYELYQELFCPPNRAFILVDEIGCERDCPSVLGSYNEPSLVEAKLHNPNYVLKFKTSSIKYQNRTSEP